MRATETVPRPLGGMDAVMDWALSAVFLKGCLSQLGNDASACKLEAAVIHTHLKTCLTGVERLVTCSTPHTQPDLTAATDLLSLEWKLLQSSFNERVLGPSLQHLVQGGCAEAGVSSDGTGAPLELLPE
eukprot:gene3617-4054_t